MPPTKSYSNRASSEFFNSAEIWISGDKARDRITPNDLPENFAPVMSGVLPERGPFSG